MTLHLRPITVKAATAWIATHHRHLRRELAGARFAVQVVDDRGVTRGVGCVTSGPRVWEGTGRCNIARIATDETANACSILYGALCRAAKALGYCEAWTYTLPHEPGTSLRAAGFELAGESRGGTHSRIGRQRLDPEQPGAKLRWVRRLAAWHPLPQPPEGV